MLKSGELRDWVEILSLVSRLDDFGASTQAWTVVGGAFAKVQAITGRELISGQQVRGQVSHRVWMRRPADLPTVVPSMRLIYGERVLEISAVIERGLRRDELELLCTEAV